MARRKTTPEWKITNVRWDTEVLIWDLMSKGYNDTQVGRFLDAQADPMNHGSTLSLDRSTIAKVRTELSLLPIEHLTQLSPEIRRFWSELQPKQMSDKCPQEETSKTLITQLNDFRTFGVPLVGAIYPAIRKKSKDASRLNNHDRAAMQKQMDIVTVILALMDSPKQILEKFYRILKTVP